MGIQVEFNSDLALRKFRTEGRLLEEHLSRTLQEGGNYDFLKEGQRNYWIERKIPLLETKDNQKLSRPLVSIKIIEATHFIELRTLNPYTKGKYHVIKVYGSNDKTIHFEGMNKVK